VRLDPADVEAIALRTAEILAERGLVAPAARELIDAAEVARRFGVTPTWARRNADRLGAVRLGTGSRPRLRFDPERVAAALSARSDGVASEEPLGRSGSGAASCPRRRRRARSGGPLPVRNLGLDALPDRTAPRRGNARGPAPGG
jgi:hypothetical protein